MGTKLDVSEIKKGSILEIDGDLFRTIDVSFMQCQQRQGSYTLKVKNLVTGGVQSKPFKSGTVLDKADVITKNAVYLYNSGDSYSFMENDSGEMHDLSKDSLEDVVLYLKENMDLFLMVYKGNVLNVILPATVTYKIKSTVPGVKGDRAQAGKKPATLETGLELMVPLHKNEGDEVTVNTETGETV
ncbi:Elongation factor P [candidate division SR1 bacterium RAAC1_SR1_1]|nr:Elongation factor P [candidate division SR1 bacterium RAAC1_SR1_1]